MGKLGNNEQLTVFDSDSDSSLFKHKTSLDKIQAELMKFGLSPTQAKVFIFLGKHGSKSAPNISRALGLPRTETYHVVNSLQNVGLVAAELVHPTLYSSLNLREAITTLVKQEQGRIDSLAEKQDTLGQLWDQIPQFAVKTNGSKQEKMQLLQSSGPIINKIDDMIDECKHELKIYGTIQDISRFYHSEIFDKVEKLPIELRTIITPSREIPDFLYDKNPDRVRVIPKNTEKKCFVIVDSKQVLTFLRNSNHLTHRLFACWSDCDAIIDMMISLFEMSWENAEAAY